MYDKILLGLNKFNLDLMEMEKQVFDKSFVDTDLLKNVLIKKRNTVLLKTIISPQEEILVELQKVTANFYEGDLDKVIPDSLKQVFQKKIVSLPQQKIITCK